MDLTGNRWDTPAHPDRDPRRRLPDGGVYEPRHDVMMAVDGAAAAALGDLARERWRRATGERLAPAGAAGDPWPEALAPNAVGAARIGIARTEPAWQGRPEIREGEALFRRAIASARRWIYLESQYVASAMIGEALAARLAEPDGPEVVIVCSAHSPNYFDRLAMDSARDRVLERLRAADAHGRLRVYAPRAAGGTPIIVHSKVTVIDDRLLRIGSANLNNRSMGFDTECDLAIEAAPGDPREGEIRTAIRRFLARLLAEHLGAAADAVNEALAQRGSLIGDIEALGRGGDCRLDAGVPPGRRGLVGTIVARTHLFDPTGPDDSWRPWRRRG
jgi:phosphatidylserine/phosphatidylglycerophosphate/cardiolipin synthase-like enzyme